MKLEELIKEFKVKQEKITELQEEIRKETQENLKFLFVGFFEKYNWLEEIRWAQYTPYFNDGDSCEFSVNDNSINGCSVYSDKVYLENEYFEDFYNENSENKYFLNDLIYIDSTIEEFKKAVGEKGLEDIFGDNVEVVITKDGINTEEYDHD